MQSYFKLQTYRYEGENIFSVGKTNIILWILLDNGMFFLRTPPSNQQRCFYPKQLRGINHPSFRRERVGGGALLYVQRKDLNLNNYVNGGASFWHVSENCSRVLKGNNIGRVKVWNEWGKKSFCWFPLQLKGEGGNFVATL